MKKNQFYFLAAGISFLSFFFDIVTKKIAQENFSEPLIFLPNFFEFVLHKNTGIAFSLPIPTSLQIILTILLLGVLVRFFLVSPQKNIFLSVGFGLIFGGALGNFIERVLFGAVTDFIAVWSFPVFNVADMAIFCGVCLLLVHEFLGKTVDSRK